MKRFISILAVVATIALAAGACALADGPVNVKITADNLYWAWLNPNFAQAGVSYGFNDDITAKSFTGFGTDGFIGTNWTTTGTHPPAWSTVLNTNLTIPAFDPDNYSVYIRASNYFGPATNPAGVIASVSYDGNILNTTGKSWQFSKDFDPVNNTGVWTDIPDAAVVAFPSAPWGTTGGLTSFNGTGASWIWSENATENATTNDVWFRTTAAVPEPMSILLGIMGLGSVAGFRKLRRK